MPGAGGPPPALVTPQDVAIGKPHSQCCELAARKLDVKVNERLVFEDAAGRTLAARGVDVRVAPALGVGHRQYPAYSSTSRHGPRRTL
jgi:beta-phosphoglucomutase-like phosphatase (HAD superfamily)